MPIKQILISLRPKQWVKNVFLLMPLVFGGFLNSPTKIFLSLKALILFSLTASAVYLFNDMIDRKNDASHPSKRSRPIAKGTLDIATASGICISLIIVSLIYSFFFSTKFFACILFYLILNLSYSIFLKKAVILDIMSIALGFEVRIWAGSVIIGIIPSIWLQLCVFILSVFLGAVKRRHEIIALENEASSHRTVLSDYSVTFLDQLINISATLSIMFYGLYTVSDSIQERLGGTNMLYTIPFVIYGVYRYLFIAHIRVGGGDPGEILLKDKPLLTCIFLWLTFASLLIYGKV